MEGLLNCSLSPIRMYKNPYIFIEASQCVEYVCLEEGRPLLLLYWLII